MTRTPLTHLDPRTEQLAAEIVDSAFKVHSGLGPGLLESVYETCMVVEFDRRGLAFNRQIPLPLVYEGVKIDSGLRLDLLVDDKVVVELKAVEKLSALYEAQLLTYLKLSGLRLGLLINFNVAMIREGIRRIVR